MKIKNIEKQIISRLRENKVNSLTDIDTFIQDLKITTQDLKVIAYNLLSKYMSDIPISKTKIESSITFLIDNIETIGMFTEANLVRSLIGTQSNRGLEDNEDIKRDRVQEPAMWTKMKSIKRKRKHQLLDEYICKELAKGNDNIFFNQRIV